MDVNRIRAHVARLWPRASGLVVLPVLLWAAFRLASHGGRVEHALALLAVPLLALGSARSKRLLVGLLPFGYLGVLYEAMGFVKNVGLSTKSVHVCDVRAFDIAISGIWMDGQRVSVQDWLQAHASLSLDLLCAIPYATFIYLSLAFAVFAYRRDMATMLRFGWTFFAVNVLGFATYHIVPTAPPWYYHAHGCVVDLAARASTGPNLARVDEWLGVGYFAAFYGRSSDVFGAIPSLHVSYPLLVAIYGYRHFAPWLRTAAFAYFALMCFSAVYLDHHWVLDVLLGIVYTLVVVGCEHALRSPMRTVTP